MELRGKRCRPSRRRGTRRSRVRSLGMALLLSAATVAPAAGGRPDIFLITADALRADHLSINGYPRPTSPAIDAFAKGTGMICEVGDVDRSRGDAGQQRGLEIGEQPREPAKNADLIRSASPTPAEHESQLRSNQTASTFVNHRIVF